MKDDAAVVSNVRLLGKGLVLQENMNKGDEVH